MRVSPNNVVDTGTTFAIGGATGELSITLVLTTMMVVWRLFFAIALPAAAQSWLPVTSGTTANLRGVSAKGQTVWISGEKGTVRKSTDGGVTWRDVAPR